MIKFVVPIAHSCATEICYVWFGFSGCLILCLGWQLIGNRSWFLSVGFLYDYKYHNVYPQTPLLWFLSSTANCGPVLMNLVACSLQEALA